MKTKSFVLPFICLLALLTIPLYGQDLLDVFTIEDAANITNISNLEEDLEEFSFLRIDNFNATYSAFEGKGNTSFQMALPLNDKETAILNLSSQDIFGSDFRVIEKTSTSEKVIDYTKPLHFIGTVAGQTQSLVSITVVNDKMMGVISYGGKNYNLQPTSETTLRNQYLLYKQADLKKELIFNCDTNSEEEPVPMGGFYSSPGSKSRFAGDIGIYLECDYEMFKTNGNSTTNTVNYVTGLFNMIKGIYASSPTNVSIVISEIKVWSTSDVYDAANASGTSELLNEFSCEHRNGYNGRLAHLLTTASVGGGIANRPTCPSGGSYTSPLYGVSGSLSNSYNSNLSVYSWDIGVIAHELGHNCSSNHTHDCVWNGNNTPIDCCGNNAGYGTCSCSVGVPVKGTIMSYCHITVNGNPGIDLSQGFHSQVAAKINDFTMNCLSSNLSVNCPSAGLNEISATNITSTSATLSCSITNNVSFYAYSYTDGTTGVCYT